MKRVSKLSSIVIGLIGTAFNSGAAAQAVPDIPKNRDNFMVVVRELIGADKKDELLKPVGKTKAKFSDGTEIETEMAWWEFIGDTHIRFVFDGDQTMDNAAPGDLVKLGLTNVDDALALALKNLKQTYGEPQSTPWEGGVMIVAGKASDFDSSYFLDRAFWRKLHKENPDGILVAVPKRGGLLYAPMSDTKSVDAMKRMVAQLHETSGSLRVSSALFLFKDDKWSVFQSAVRR